MKRLKIKLTLLLIMCSCMFTTHASVVTAVDQLSNDKVYNISCPRGSFSTYNGLLANTTKTSLGVTAGRFAIISYNNAYFLYSIDDKAFFNRSTIKNSSDAYDAKEVTIGPFDALTISSSSNSLYPFKLAIGGELNIINSWDGRTYGINVEYYGSEDDGNCYAIEATDEFFNPQEAINILDNYYGKPTVKFQVVNSSDDILASMEEKIDVGTNLTDIPESLKKPFTTYSITPLTVASGSGNILKAVASFDFPKTLDVKSAVWYNMTIRNGNYICYNSAEPYHTVKASDITKNQKSSDAFCWTFVGNPYTGIYIYNKSIAAKTLTAKGVNRGDYAVMTDSEYSWLADITTNGFVLRANNANMYINEYGGSGGYLAMYGDASDSGCLLNITPVDFTKVASWDWTDDAKVSLSTNVLTDLTSLTDNDVHTELVVNGFSSGTIIKAHVNRGVKLTGYALTAGADKSSAPASWLLQGSNDDVTWTTLDERTNITFTDTPTILCTFNKPSDRNTVPSFRYYQLVVNANNGGEDLIVAEWQLFGFPEELTTEVTKNGGTITTQYPANSDSEVADNLIVNDISKKYCTGINNGTGWVQFNSPVPIHLSRYGIVQAAFNPERDPMNWVLQGSNDGITWDELDTETDQIFYGWHSTLCFNVTTDKAYSLYRLNVTKNAGDSRLQFCNYLLYGNEVINIGSTGYATYSSTNAIDYSLTAGLQAYSVKYEGGSKAQMKAIDHAVEANTGVMLKGEPDTTYELAYSTEGTTVEGNSLVATSYGAITTDGTFYVLSNNEESKGLGFYKLATGQQVPTHKAYLSIQGLVTSEFVNFNNFTSIENVKNDMKESASSSYNVCGQRVSDEYTGVIIKNGVKYIKR